jgi:hypothetical protein
MNNLVNTFFGPLNKDSCVYFLFLTVIFFSLLVFFLVIELFYIIRNYKNLNIRTLMSGILIFFNLFIGYFVNRILYTMCSNSLIK